MATAKDPEPKNLAIYFLNTTKLHVNTPGQVMGTTDPQTKQIKALLQKEVDDLAEMVRVATEHWTEAVRTLLDRGVRRVGHGTLVDRCCHPRRRVTRPG